MKDLLAVLVTLSLLCSPARVCMAHRVNVFAWVDGDSIQVECGFSKKRKVRHGRLTVSDLTTGATLLEGTTDEQGLFRFQPDPLFLKTGHGLHILLNAGEGHQSEWKVFPEELLPLLPSSGSPHGDRQAVLGDTAIAVPSGGAQGQAVVSLTVAELERVMDRVLETRLAPIRQRLARQEDSGPDVRDVVGGLGWLLGLLGLATYMKCKR